MGQTWSFGIVFFLQMQHDKLDKLDKGKLKPRVENFSETEADGFDYIHSAKFLAMRNVEIVPLDVVCLDSGIEMQGSIAERRVQLEAIGAGTSMQVVLAKWESRVVAVKVPRTAFQQSDRRRQRLYNSFMYDIFFEIQIMSHKPLCDHPNIVKLLGISSFGYSLPAFVNAGNYLSNVERIRMFATRLMRHQSWGYTHMAGQLVVSKRGHCG
jgi:hypothetical protein